MTFKGINFRQNATHANGFTDSADDTYYHKAGNEIAFSAVRGGFPGGFGMKSGQSWVNGGDRNVAGIDTRLAGMCSSAGSSNAQNFLLKLPNGPGQYRVRMAVGDAIANRNGQTWRIRDGDGGTSLLFISGASNGGVGYFLDTNGTSHSYANWPANNTTATLTFATDTLCLDAQADFYIAHLAVEPVSGSTASGVTLSATSSLIAGSASGVAAGTATGVTLTGTASLIAGLASGQISGTLAIGPLKNNTGTLLASQTGITVHVYATGGSFVVTKTGLSSDGSGVLSVVDPAITPGTTYRVVIVMTGGAEGLDKRAAT